MKKALVLILVLILTISAASDTFAMLSFEGTPEVTEEEVADSDEPSEKETDKEESADNNEKVESLAETENMSVFLEADAGVLPENSVLTTEEVEDKAIQEAVKGELSEGEHIAASYVLDINVLEDGKKVQPDGEVLLSFENELFDNKNLTAHIFHIKDGKAEELEYEQDKNIVTAVTDGFSYYTVEFTYNNLQYVMEGDTEIKLSEILEYVGLEGDVSEVTGSNDSLFSFEYKNDEWYVKANRAFTSNEWMKVVIDGIEYEIVVTDAETHVHNGVTFKAWTSTTQLPTSSGNYYLTNDIVIPEQNSRYLTSSTLREINVCFNGHTVTFAGKQKQYGSYYYIDGYGNNLDNTLNLYDCVGTSLIDGGGENFHNGFASVSAEADTANMVINVYGGNYINFSAAVFKAWYIGVVNLYGGTIRYSGEKYGGEIVEKVNGLGVVNYLGTTIKPWVEYDANGGVGAPERHEYDWDGSTTVSSVKPTKEGYKFLGWSVEELWDDEEYTEVTYQPGDTITNNKRNTLHAVYGVPYAEFNSSTGVLRIFCDAEGKYTDGQTSGTKTYWIGIEDITGTTKPKWYAKRASVTSVVIEDEFRPKTAYMMFAGMTNLTSITGIANLDTSNATGYMYGMFYQCEKLTSLDVTNFDTSNVTNMNSMFYGCSKLTSLNVSGFNTSNVTNMQLMFYNCNKLTSLNVTNFNTSNVTNMSAIFGECDGLTSIDLSNFDTSKVENMSGMFRGSGLTSIDVSGFDTSNVTDMCEMFGECDGLTSIDLSNFNTSKVTDMNYMFGYCDNLTTIYVSELWSTAAVTDSTDMFKSCTKLVGSKGTTYNASYTDAAYAHIDGGTSNPGYLSMVQEAFAEFDSSTGVLRIFKDDKGKYTNGQVSGTKTYYAGIEDITGTTYPKWYSNRASVTSVVIEDEFKPKTAFRMFYEMTDLASITGMSNLNTSNVTNMNSMFSSCGALTSLDLSNFDTSRVTTMRDMFCGCGITSLDLSGFDTSNVTNMSGMFCQTYELSSLDLSNFDTSKVTDMSDMFSYSEVVTIYVSDTWSTAAVTNSRDMFDCCLSLVGGNGTIYDSNYTDATRAVIDTASTPGYLTEKVDAFILTADANGGTIPETTGWVGTGSTATKSVPQGAGYGTLPTPTRTGYTFNGWFTLASGGTTVTSSTLMGSADTTIFAQWTEHTATLTYNNGGHGTTPANVTMTYTQAINAASALTEAGWNFLGWRRSDNNQLISASTQIKAANTDPVALTLTAEWEAGETLYAEFDSSTGALRIFKGMSGLHADGDVVGTKTYYTGMEDLTGSTNPKWYANRASITSVVIEDEFKPKTAYRMFMGTKITTVTGIENLDTSAVTSMAYMFRGTKITNPDLSHFNTATKLTTMTGMFYGCTSLTNLDLSAFSTVKVTKMGGLFYGCTNLTTLDLSNFNTSKVTAMNAMFQSCSKLTTIYVSSTWSTAAVTNSTDMFTGCTKLVGGNGTAYDANYIDATRAVIDTASTPGYLTGPQETFAEFDSSNGRLRIFHDNASTYTNGQTSGTKTYYAGLETITGATAPKWYAKRASVTSVVIEDTFRPKTAYALFYGMTHLTSITGIAKLNTSEVANMRGMFSNCSVLTSIDVSHFDTSNVTNMRSMFSSCGALTSLDLSNFDTSNVTTMYGMFSSCTSLEELDIRSFETVATQTGMIQGLSSLKRICLGENWTFAANAADA